MNETQIFSPSLWIEMLNSENLVASLFYPGCIAKQVAPKRGCRTTPRRADPPLAVGKRREMGKDWLSSKCGVLQESAGGSRKTLCVQVNTVNAGCGFLLMYHKIEREPKARFAGKVSG